MTYTYAYAKKDVVYYTVTFADGMGNTLKTEKVEGGRSATAPAAPKRDGYTFKGWDRDFGKVTGDMTVTARWEKNEPPAPKPAPSPTPEKKVSSTLIAKLTAKGRRALMISWNKVDGAQGYDVFFGNCSKKQPGLKAAVKGNNKVNRTFRKLKKNTPYKACVKAWAMKKGKKTYVATSPMVHAYTSGGTKYHTNARGITVKKKEITLKTGRSYAIKAKVSKRYRSRLLMSKNHTAPLRYLSTDPGVAKVTKKGKITGRKSGRCYVYVLAHNGVSRKLSVLVR